MAWTKLYQALPTHPKTLHLAELLGYQDSDLAWAKVARLWLWALDYCPHGRLTVASRPMTDGQIARAANFHGDATVFVRSLIGAGFVDSIQGGSGGKTLQIHDWEEYGGKLHEKSVQDAERKRAERSAGRPSDVHMDGAGRSDKKRIDKKEERRGDGPLPVLAMQGDPGEASPEVPEAEESPEVRDLNLCVDAYAAWSHPSREKKIEAVQELRTLGMSFDYIRNGAQVNRPADVGFWDVVKALKAAHGHGRKAKAPPSENGNGHEQVRVNGNPSGFRPPVLEERREVVQQRRDEARAKCREILVGMDPDERDGWMRDAKADAEREKIPEVVLTSYVESKLLSRIAKEHGIEGL